MSSTIIYLLYVFVSQMCCLSELIFFKNIVPNYNAVDIFVQLSHCNMQNITLSNVTLQTSGIYRCEVSTDGPKFEMVFKSANMNVLGKY